MSGAAEQSGAGEGEGAAAAERRFTRAELVSRNTKADAVIVIDNGVYDVTKFLEEHPGGEEVLLENAGKDATEPFEDVGHSSDGRALMKKYKIGEVVDEDRVASKQRHTQYSDSEDSSNSGINSWLLPLVLGILATIVYRYLFL